MKDQINNAGNGSAAMQLDVSVSKGFEQFLAEKHCSILMSAYRANKLIALKLNEQGKPAIEERTFETCMGIAAQTNELLVATNHQIWRLFEYTHVDKPVAKGGQYVPNRSWVTGDVKCHDLGFDENGAPIFVNTMFSCISRVSEVGSFEVVWKPSFISEIALEDRCHLNGMALENGQPKYVTAVATTNEKMAWRNHKEGGGVLIDIVKNEVLVDGLSMPHSPRIHGGWLWLLNSGTGEFGYVDQAKRRFIPVLKCVGFPRGLSFIGDYAVIGTSNYRDERLFHGLPIERHLKSINKEPQAGVTLFNLKTGRVEHQLVFNNLIQELYDVAILRDPSPSISGLQGDDMKWKFRVI